MAFENLSDRERQILANLIEYYIQSADPVGSRVIANKFKMGISSATIRNTLQDLEELGLVEQPHTSAGRIPTDTGYRVYVDYLIKPERLTEKEKRAIKQSILKEGRGISEMLGQTAKVLGEITNHLGLTISPRFEAGVLHSIKLIPISEGRIMAVVIVESGLARSLILEIEADISLKSLAELEAVLNERLSGLTLSEIRHTITERIKDVSGEGRLIKLIIDSKDKIWRDNYSELVHVAGTDRLLKAPEFSNTETLSSLIKMIEDGNVLYKFLAQIENEGLLISIGKENKIDEIMKCSLVTSSYRVGNISGKIGIIGPTRMPYSKLVSVVEYTARSITDVLSGMDKKEE